ncbi:MAG TPA: ribosome-associated translation inhibitor RaiA [Beijerinckiaceae bacterium]|nr:ribosome-associated translation inhibitor RaiA [Beijerinckiaceae bacterium]
MSLRVTGKNLDIGDVLRNQAEEKINEVIAKYADGGYSGHVTVVKDGQGFRTDCTLHLGNGQDLHVAGEAADAYASLSVAVERIAKQLRKIKRRRSDHAGHGAGARPPEPALHDDDDVDVVETTSAGAAIVAEPVANARTLTVLGAVAAFEGNQAPVLVFRNAGTGRINVLYRRADGHYGWVDIG